MRISTFVFGAAFLGLVGCGNPTGNGYFDTGAGLNLYTPGTTKATQDLQKYYAELCKQANPLQQANEKGQITCASKNTLVRTGFNDIDLRCDGYLAWIDRQRIEASTFRSGATAVNTLATGLGSVSERGIRNIAQVLGFANSIYDAYNNAILTGLESSTIKKLVYARRAAFRKEFSGLEYPTFADATYALRGYLRICTPQTIVLTANEYAVAAVNGNPIPDLDKAAREQAAFINRPKPKDPATPPRRNQGAVPTFSALFSEPGFDKSHVEAIQKAGCIKVTGKADRATVSTVKMLHQWKAALSDGDNKLSTAEWESIQAEIQAQPCDATKFSNIYENLAHGSNDGAGIVNTLVAATLRKMGTDDENRDAISALFSKPLADEDVRNFLKTLRVEGNVPDSFPGLGDLSGQLTPNLLRRVSPKSFEKAN